MTAKNYRQLILPLLLLAYALSDYIYTRLWFNSLLEEAAAEGADLVNSIYFFRSTLAFLAASISICLAAYLRHTAGEQVPENTEATALTLRPLKFRLALDLTAVIAFGLVIYFTGLKLLHLHRVYRDYHGVLFLDSSRSVLSWLLSEWWPQGHWKQDVLRLVIAIPVFAYTVFLFFKHNRQYRSTLATVR